MAASRARNELTFPRPLTTVDLAIFAVDAQALQVLLVKRSGDASAFPDAWALPGGFVDVALDRDLEQCALRKLKEKTGVEAPYLEQVGSWGNDARDPRGWSATHVYLALLGKTRDLLPGGNTADTRWFPVKGERVGVPLAFDHAEILKEAVLRLRSKVTYTSLAAFFMSSEFTLTELQHTYEIVLGRDLEKKAFRTRILATDLVEEVPGRMREGQGRPAQLYRLRSRRRPVFFARTFSEPRS
jgi:ADP-ribose pyrophosphatase YjhB (NUDIX family)